MPKKKNKIYLLCPHQTTMTWGSSTQKCLTSSLIWVFKIDILTALLRTTTRRHLEHKVCYSLTITKFKCSLLQAPHNTIRYLKWRRASMRTWRCLRHSRASGSMRVIAWRSRAAQTEANLSLREAQSAQWGVTQRLVGARAWIVPINPHRHQC